MPFKSQQSSQDLKAIKCHEGIDPRFLFYALLAKSNAILSLVDEASHGTKRLKTELLEKLEIPIPPLREQRAIVAVFAAIDAKIELNRRMNTTLEAMARAIFTSWFVDFAPVRAKMEGRQPFGMDADTAALFPDAFEDSPQGQIPRGWQVKALPDVIDVNPPRALRNGADAPYLEMSNLPTHAARALRWETRAFTSGMKFINGDTLVARITPCLENGKTAYVDFLKEGEIGWGSTEYIVLHGKPPLSPEYAYFLARSDNFRAFAIKNMTGTSGRQRVPTTVFDSYLVIVPPSSIVKQFSDVASPMMVTMKQRDEEAQTLAAIRDILLPKLLSGEVRVGEAEKAVGMAV